MTNEQCLTERRSLQRKLSIPNAIWANRFPNSNVHGGLQWMRAWRKGYKRWEQKPRAGSIGGGPEGGT